MQYFSNRGESDGERGAAKEQAAEEGEYRRYGRVCSNTMKSGKGSGMPKCI